MAETSLSQILIKGAGEAIAPAGAQELVTASIEGASKQLTEGVKGIGEAFAGVKEKIDEQNKIHDTNWENIIKDMDANLGSLDKNYWEKMTDHVEELKATKYDTCADGKEGNRCRKRGLMELNKLVSHTADVKDTVTSYKDLQEKMDNEEISKSNYQTPRKKAILGSFDGQKSTLAPTSDTEVFKLEAELEALKSQKSMTRGGPGVTDEMREIQEKIEKLRENDTEEYGWNISYIDEHTQEEVNERVTLKDLNDLIPIKDDEIGNKMVTATTGVKDNNSDFKNGVKGSSAFDERQAEKNAKDAVNEKNLVSYWYDDFGFGAPLNERFSKHPAFMGMKYSDLNLDVAQYDKNNNNKIDEGEWAKISTDDITKVRSVLSDPTHPLHKNNPEIAELSLEIARDDWKNNLKKESEIDLYGTEYWNKENLEYPAGTVHDDIVAKQKAIKEDLTTPRPGETLEQFKERDGIVGAVAAKGITWNSETKSWNKPEFNDEEIIKQMIDKGQITE